MGEPDTPTYERHYDFERRWPVDSPAQLADYAEWLVGLVAVDGDRQPETKLMLNVYHRSAEDIPLAEFRERFDEFRFDDLYEAELIVRDGDSFTLTLNLRDHVLGDKSAAIRVVGTDKDRVQAVKTRVKDDGEARTEAARQRVAEAAAKQEAEVEAAQQKEAFGIGVQRPNRRSLPHRPRPRNNRQPRTAPCGKRSRTWTTWSCLSSRSSQRSSVASSWR
jgi:hypothetical protein